MSYLALKTVHQGAVVLSFLGFFARGLASLSGAGWVRGRLARTLPHGVDTVLLGSAVGLAVMAQLNPLNTPWLLAKLVGLVLYVALGVVALRASFPLPLRKAVWVAALGVYAAIVVTAITKHPPGAFTTG